MGCNELASEPTSKVKTRVDVDGVHFLLSCFGYSQA